MDFRQIVWLASYPKSGNTWVRLFLDAYFLQELDINEIVSSVGDDAIHRYVFDDHTSVWRWPIDVQQLLRGTALTRIVTNYNYSDNPIPLFVKTHQANVIANGVELLPAALTQATIYIVRDPRDVFPSFGNHMGLNSDETLRQMTNDYDVLKGGKNKASDFISSWDKHAQSYLDAADHNTLVVRYEDLKADPFEWFSRILWHAGVNVDTDRVRQAIEMTRLEQLRKREQEDGFNEASFKAKDPFFNTGKTGKKIDPKYKSQIERNFRKMMLKLNYLGKRKANGTFELH